MAWGSISLFAGFLEKENSLETLIVTFENVSPKGFFWLIMKNFEISVLTANSRYLQTAALKWSPNAILGCSLFRVYIYIYNFFFDGQFRLFSFSDSKTYLDTEISIISLHFGGLEITLVWFSPVVCTVFALFTFHVLVAYGGPRGSM